MGSVELFGPDRRNEEAVALDFNIEELAEQGINIFNPNDEFYTDLCFHFISPIDGRDIPVKDRIKLFFPNITLCDEGCNIKGINLTNWKAICECTLNNLMHNNKTLIHLVIF